MSDPRLTVLVHGAWHGAWCWAALAAELDRRGLPSLAVDLPGHGASTDPLGALADDAAHLTAVLDGLDAAPGDVVLVGHSYGGAVITEAATGRDDLAHLVYVAAFALEPGESPMSALRSMERHEVALASAIVVADDGLTSTIDPSAARAAFYGGCTDEEVRAAVARLGPQTLASLGGEVTGAPRASIESTYVRCTADEAVHPAHQAEFASRCTHRVDLDADHSPFLSAVDVLADVLEPLARRDGTGGTS